MSADGVIIALNDRRYPKDNDATLKTMTMTMIDKDQITGRCRWQALPLLLTLPLLALLALGGCVLPPQTQSGQTQPAPGQRVLPQSSFGSTGTLKALEQLTELKEELKKLRNAVEELEFNSDTAKRRQQNLFQDLDSRLLRLERVQRLSQPVDGVAGNGFNNGLNNGFNNGLNNGVNNGITPSLPLGGLAPLGSFGSVGLIPGTGTGTATGTDIVTDPGTIDGAEVAVVGSDTATQLTPAAPGDDAAQASAVSVLEQQVYERAFNLLKQSKYQDAIAGFVQLTETWPKSDLADDAYYWMSEARYVNREFEAALKGFRTVAARYPDSPRVPEALLKIGYIQYDIGAYEDAAEVFRNLLNRFPGHQVAVSAQTRLRRIEQIIQQ